MYLEIEVNKPRSNVLKNKTKHCFRNKTLCNRGIKSGFKRSLLVLKPNSTWHIWTPEELIIEWRKLVLKAFTAGFSLTTGSLGQKGFVLHSETNVWKATVTSNFNPQQVSPKCWSENIGHRLTVGEKSIAKNAVDGALGRESYFFGEKGLCENHRYMSSILYNVQMPRNHKAVKNQGPFPGWPFLKSFVWLTYCSEEIQGTFQ